MKTRLLYIVLLLVLAPTYAQRKHIANEHFKRFNHSRVIDLYTKLYEKGDDSQLVLARLGDAYYKNANTEKAEFWYKKLIDTHKSSVSSDYVFKYIQTLKGNGKYEEAAAINKWYRGKNNSFKSVVIAKGETSPIIDAKNEEVYLHNLSINTPYSDFGGFVHGNTLYYSSTKQSSAQNEKKYSWNDQPFLASYESSLSIKEDVIEDVHVIEALSGKKMSGVVNTKYHEATVILTRDGKTMYFTRDNYDGKKVRKDKQGNILLKIYRATLVSGVWKNIEELPFNNDEYSVGHPALSNDEKTLFFVSNQPGGYGGTDLYKVSIADNGTFGIPKNLGNSINTDKNEMFPFVGNKESLYFSSNGHGGYGLLDVFKAVPTSDSVYTIVNLGVPFNSSKDDLSFSIDIEEKRGFISSNRDGGKGDDDIYSFVIAKLKKHIEGRVTELDSGEILTEAKVKLLDQRGNVIQEQIVDANGFYRFESVEWFSGYTIISEKKNYNLVQKVVLASPELSKIVTRADLQMFTLIKNNEIVLNPIYFELDKSRITESAREELEKVVKILRENPEMIIKIESHTDCRGSSLYNRNLSDRRAKSTRDYIYSRGIAKNRIQSAIGYGEDQLIEKCQSGCRSCTEAQHQRNRRSKFIIINSKK